jgi:hypothetical protein
MIEKQHTRLQSKKKEPQEKTAAKKPETQRISC